MGSPGPPSIFSVSSHAVSLGTPSSRGARPKGTLPAKVQKRHVSYSHVAQNIAAHVLLILRHGRSWAGWEVQAQPPRGSGRTQNYLEAFFSLPEPRPAEAGFPVLSLRRGRACSMSPTGHNPSRGSLPCVGARCSLSPARHRPLSHSTLGTASAHAPSQRPVSQLFASYP